MMIVPNEESDWVHRVIRYIHTPAVFNQRDYSEAEKKRERIFKMSWTDLKFSLPIWQKGLLVLKKFEDKQSSHFREQSF